MICPTIDAIPANLHAHATICCCCRAEHCSSVLQLAGTQQASSSSLSNSSSSRSYNTTTRLEDSQEDAHIQAAAPRSKRQECSSGCHKRNTNYASHHKSNSHNTKTNMSTLRRHKSHTTTKRASLQQTIISTLIFAFIALVACVCAYNLDTDKALHKHGPKGSYFGYSLAQHATYEPQNVNSTFRAFVLVGAPRADVRAENTQRPGALYRCDFSLLQSCHLLDIDAYARTRDTNYKLTNWNEGFKLTNNASTQRTRVGSPDSSASTAAVAERDNQWLGVSVKSQGPNGYAMACAHRYVIRGKDYRFGQGICYSLTANLTLHKSWQPCLGRSIRGAHEDYGYCQAGTSGDISESSHIVIGSPGTHVWRGTVFTNSLDFHAKNDLIWHMAASERHLSRVDAYSYLGMSALSSSKFFNNQLEYYVSGAPRHHDVGQVLFMTNEEKGNSTFRIEQVLNGEQMGSSYGYTLAKLDFNGDKLMDLAVAAPFYFNQSAQEGGAVYLYSSNGKQMVPAGKLTGPAESRFGFALSSCGDLNHDKFDDLAVGAPYDLHGGAVYIYLGSSHGLNTRPSQVIRASQVAPLMQTFGYSLSGGLDMDRNGYPDLAVGAYADDSIYILRGRPIVEITTKIEGNLTKIDPNRTTCGEGNTDRLVTGNQLPCFKFQACFELDPRRVGEYSDTMRLRYRIEAETFTGVQKYARVKFHDSEQSETPHIIERDIIIRDYAQYNLKIKKCHTERVYIKDKGDIQTPIQFKLTYSLVPDSSSSSSGAQPSGSSSSLLYSMRSSSMLFSSSLSSSSDAAAISASPSPSSGGQLLTTDPVDSAEGITPPFPILNQDEALRIFSAKFLKDCGANDVCESQLEVNGQLQMPKETLGINEQGVPSDKQANLTITIKNSNEPAYESRLFVKHPAALEYSGFKALKQATAVECTKLDRNLIKCDLGNPMPRGGLTRLHMLFNTNNQAGQFEFNLMVNTTSQNARDAKASQDVSGTVRKKVEPQYTPRPQVPDVPTHEPPAWLVLMSILLGVLLFAGLFYCLHAYGFFERSKARYHAANTEERFN